MDILVLASRKGGAGKTMVSRHLAVQAELDGAGPVAIIDADPMAGLAEWWNARAHSDTPAYIGTNLSDIGVKLAQLKDKGFKTVVIDTPPAATDAIHTLIAQATLVIIPVRPSPDDLRAVGRTIDIAEAAGKPMLFVLNGAHNRARVTAGAAISLSKHAPVADVILHQRTDYAASSANGMVVSEIDPLSPSAKEIAALWSYVSAYLEKCGNGQSRSTLGKARRS